MLYYLWPQHNHVISMTPYHTFIIIFSIGIQTNNHPNLKKGKYMWVVHCCKWEPLWYQYSSNIPKVNLVNVIMYTFHRFYWTHLPFSIKEILKQMSQLGVSVRNNLIKRTLNKWHVKHAELTVHNLHSATLCWTFLYTHL